MKAVKERAIEQAFLRISDEKEFDEGVFRRLVDKVRVISMVEVEFVFRDGRVVREVL